MKDVRLLDYFDTNGEPLYDGAMQDFVIACHEHHVDIRPDSAGQYDARTIGRPMIGCTECGTIEGACHRTWCPRFREPSHSQRPIQFGGVQLPALPIEDDMQEFGASKVGQRVEGEDLEYLERSHWHHADPPIGTVPVPGSLKSVEEYVGAPFSGRRAHGGGDSPRACQVCGASNTHRSTCVLEGPVSQ